MAAGVKFEVKGLSDIEAALKELPFELRKSVIRRGLRAAADLMVQAVAQLAPRAPVHKVVRSGKEYPLPLASSIQSRVRAARTGDLSAQIGPGKAFWGMFQELGTRYQHPQPFMRPAMERNAQAAVAAFATGAKSELDAAVRRVRRGR